MKRRTHWAWITALVALSTGVTCSATLSGQASGANGSLGSSGVKTASGPYSYQVPGSMPDQDRDAFTGTTGEALYADAGVGHDMWEGTKTTAKKVGDTMEDVGERTGQTLKHAGQRTGNTLKHAGQKTGETLEHVGERTTSTAKHVYHRTGETMKHMTKGSKTEAVGERTTSTPKKSYHAHHHKKAVEPVGEKTMRSSSTKAKTSNMRTRPESVGERTSREPARINPESPSSYPSSENDYANPYR